MKKIKNNNEAFTLIEILAAVTILGILSLATISSVNKVIDKSKEKHYKNAERQLKSAGQEYIQDNRSLLPKEIGGKNKIILDNLIEKKYITTIKDYKDKDCDRYKSYVQVYKYEQNKYSYFANLVCDNHNTNIENTFKPRILITSPNKLKLKFEIEDQSDKKGILSYNYIITKGSEEIYNSGNIYVPEESRNSKIVKEVDIEKYTPGIIKLTVKATNVYGNESSKTYTDSTTAKDKNGPDCNIESIDLKPKKWRKGESTITVGCKDKLGESGCKREKFTKVFTQTTEYGNIIIEDEEGNTTKCKVAVYIDNTPPSAPVWEKNTSNGSWTNQEVMLTVKAHDDGSGIEKIVYSYDKKEELTDWLESKPKDGTNSKIWVDQIDTIVYARAYDKVGNVSEWSEGTPIRIDLTKPECISNGGSDKWTNKDVKLYGKCFDKYGECTLPIIEKVISKETNDTISPGVVMDQAGNFTTCPNQTVKIDKTAPTITKIEEQKECNRVNMSFKINDTFSGVNSNTYEYNYPDKNSVWNKISGNTWTIPGDVKIKVSDNAGNTTILDEKINFRDCTPHNEGTSSDNKCNPHCLQYLCENGQVYQNCQNNNCTKWEKVFIGKTCSNSKDCNTSWSECRPNGKRYRTCERTGWDGKKHTSQETQSCNYVKPQPKPIPPKKVCTSWSICTSSRRHQRVCTTTYYPSNQKVTETEYERCVYNPPKPRPKPKPSTPTVTGKSCSPCRNRRHRCSIYYSNGTSVTRVEGCY